MLTLTVPHTIRDGAAASIARLYDACSRFWRSVAWRRFVERWGIVAKVRVFDASHGGRNGTHPHFHVALFPTVTARVSEAEVIRAELREFERAAARERREMRERARSGAGFATNAEREAIKRFDVEVAERLMEFEGCALVAETTGATIALRDAPQSARRAFVAALSGGLLPAWRTAVEQVGCTYPVAPQAVDIVPAEHAERYFTKWGLAREIGLSTEKDASHLRLIDVAAAGLGDQSAIAGELYREFCEAISGRTWVTGLTDTCRVLGVTEDDGRAYLERMRERAQREREREGLEPLPQVPELAVKIRAHLWRAFISLGHTEVFRRVDEIAEEVGHDPERVQSALDDLLWRHLAKMRSVDEEIGDTDEPPPLDDDDPGWAPDGGEAEPR